MEQHTWPGAGVWGGVVWRRHALGLFPALPSMSLSSPLHPHLIFNVEMFPLYRRDMGHVWVSLSQALLGELGTQLHLLKTVGQTPALGWCHL